MIAIGFGAQAFELATIGLFACGAARPRPHEQDRCDNGEANDREHEAERGDLLMGQFTQDAEHIKRIGKCIGLRGSSTAEQR